MDIDKLNKMSFDKLIGLYGVINEICSDFSRLTDGYSLATGDKMFETMPEAIKQMIQDRQRFFSYRNVVKDILKDKITKIFENNE